MFVNWDSFIWFGTFAVVLWVLSSFFAIKDKYKLSVALSIAGLLVFALFIAFFWHSLQRPPMRTIGETRLWYSFFLPFVGLIVYLRWKYKLAIAFGTVLSTVFILINILKPEIHDKTLMPALQSFWFAPHVIVYMFSYAVIAAATLISVYTLIKKNVDFTEKYKIIDNLIYTGTSFLTIGMLIGAIWAKDAWGHYWSWDPKETWAAATWFGLLLFIHFRLANPKRHKTASAILIIAFVLLQVCWFGINYLSSAKGLSVHVY